MQPVVLTRAGHLLGYVEVLRRIGAPVDTELRRAQLPVLLSEIADHYIPVKAGLRFLESIARREGLDDLGFLVTQKGTLGRLDNCLLTAMRSAPTLYSRLWRFGEFVSVENTFLRLSLIREGDSMRLCLGMTGLPRTDAIQYAEWLQIDVLINIIRDGIGASWQPLEVTFQSHFKMPVSALEKFPDVRFRQGSPHTSILVPARLLGHMLPCEDISATQTEIAPAVELPDFAGSLKLALRAYVPEGGLDINAAAETLGLSTRTLQRRLVQAGLNYRTLVREARIEAAAAILANANTSVLDAAYAVGYTDPSNFARAFRQVTGYTPRRNTSRHSKIENTSRRRSR